MGIIGQPWEPFGVLEGVLIESAQGLFFFMCFGEPWPVKKEGV